MASPPVGLDPRCIEFYNTNYLSFGFNEKEDAVYGWVFLIVGNVALVGNGLALYFFITIDKNQLTSRSLKPSTSFVKTNSTTKLERKWTGTKLLFFCFALSDLLIGVISIFCATNYFKQRIYMDCYSYPNSLFTCDIMGFVMEFVMKLGPYLFAAMCIFRCLAVYKPFLYRRLNSTKLTIVTIAACFPAPLILALLPYIYGKQYQVTIVAGWCSFSWHTIYEYGTKSFTMCQIFYSAIPTILPCIAVLPSGILVATKLICQARRASKLSSSVGRKDSKTKTGVMLLVLTVIFCVSYLPYVLIIILDLLNVIYPPSYYRHIYPVVFLFMFISSALNPFAYHLKGKHIFKDDSQRVAFGYVKSRVMSDTISTNAAVCEPVGLSDNEHVSLKSVGSSLALPISRVSFSRGGDSAHGETII